jgi:hypothetical protein
MEKKEKPEQNDNPDLTWKDVDTEIDKIIILIKKEDQNYNPERKTRDEILRDLKSKVRRYSIGGSNRMKKQSYKKPAGKSQTRKRHIKMLR